jgi:hypothetical protein
MSADNARNFRTAWINQVEDAQVATSAPASYVQVLKALGRRATAKGEWANAYPSQERLAAECAVSLPTIKRAMAWGRKHALIKREEYGNRRQGKAARYRLVLKPADVHRTMCQAEWDSREDHRVHITAVRRAAIARRWQQQQGLGITVVSDDIQIRPLIHEGLGIKDEPPITTKGAAAAAELHAADPVDSITSLIEDLTAQGTARAAGLAALLTDTTKYHGHQGRQSA